MLNIPWENFWWAKESIPVRTLENWVSIMIKDILCQKHLFYRLKWVTVQKIEWKNYFIQTKWEEIWRKLYPMFEYNNYIVLEDEKWNIVRTKKSNIWDIIDIKITPEERENMLRPKKANWCWKKWRCLTPNPKGTWGDMDITDRVFS